MEPAGKLSLLRRRWANGSSGDTGLPFRSQRLELKYTRERQSSQSWEEWEVGLCSLWSAAPRPGEQGCPAVRPFLALWCHHHRNSCVLAAVHPAGVGKPRGAGEVCSHLAQLPGEACLALLAWAAWRVLGTINRGVASKFILLRNFLL